MSKNTLLLCYMPWRQGQQKLLQHLNLCQPKSQTHNYWYIKLLTLMEINPVTKSCEVQWNHDTWLPDTIIHRKSFKSYYMLHLICHFLFFTTVSILLQLWWPWQPVDTYIYS